MQAFSNDDKLSEQIYNAGEKAKKKVENALHKNYDKLMNLKMQTFKILIMLVVQAQLQCTIYKDLF